MLGVGLTLRPQLKPGGLTLAQLQASAVWAFSLRKVVPTYSGSCLKVRRSSDSTTLDIGFDGTGWLDTTALLAFVGANNGFIDTWYDQSPSGLNVSNSTANSQPAIAVTGAMITLANGKPAVRWIAGNTIGLSHATGVPFTANCTLYAVCEKIATSTGTAQIIGGTSGCAGLRFDSSTGIFRGLRTGQANLTGTAAAPSTGIHALSCVFTAAGTLMTVDGVETVGASAPALTVNVRSLGNRFAASFTDGFGNQGTNPRYSEALYFNTALSSADIATLRADAITTYGTP